MKKLSLKLQIIFIFLLPSLVLVYLLTLYINQKYTQLQESQTLKFSTQYTSILSSMIHNLQVERGLSSGYMQKNHLLNIKERLLAQYEKTDKAYNKLNYYLELKTDSKKRLMDKVGFKVKPVLDKIMHSLEDINKIRESVLHFNLSFDEKIKYYTDINTNIILVIKIIDNIIYNHANNSMIIEVIQYMKEQAGLERAYIFSQLLYQERDENIIRKLSQLQLTQKNYEEEFYSIASKEAIDIYNANLTQEIKNKMNSYRTNFDEGVLDAEDAHAWFLISTRYIDSLGKALDSFFISFIRDANLRHDTFRSDMYLAFGFGISSYIALASMLFYLLQLMNKEEKYKEDLRFASYAFDSHEAMVITDMDGTVIRVNNAFSEITGYTREEAIGGNPRLLKSDRHKDEFYVEMFETLKSTGTWNGEIYNRRKNGDVYPELLSITTIKDSQGKAINYIAQFLDISELKDAQEKAFFQADHDFLTGILNRKAMTQRLQEEFSRASRHHFFEAFLFIDLDNFKAINDNYGHAVGDLMLIEFTKSLESVLRKEDILARLSGDEFAIIVTNNNADKIALVSTIEHISDKIFKVISKEFLLNSHTLSIGASIGVSIFPEIQEDSNCVVSQADEAMYKAKSAGKNQIVFYD